MLLPRLPGGHLLAYVLTVTHGTLQRNNLPNQVKYPVSHQETNEIRDEDEELKNSLNP